MTMDGGGRFMETAARLINQWVDPDDATRTFLASQNDVELVKGLPHEGPKLMLKAQVMNQKRCGDVCQVCELAVLFDH